MLGVTTAKVCTHRSVKVTKRNGVAKQRTVHVLLGNSGDTVYGVHDANLSNVTRGVVERIFTVDYGEGFRAPIPQTDMGFRGATMHSWHFLLKNVPKVSKFTVEQFLATYSDARLRRRYEDARDSLLIKPVSRKDSEVKTFPKAEKTNFSAKLDPAPRIISPRDPRYNFALGLYIKPIEGALYKVLNRMCGGTTVMKGLNALQVGEAINQAWGEFSQPVGIPFDAKRFDQHTRVPALKYEQRVYKLCYDGGQRDELARLLSWQLESYCRAYLPDGKVKFKMRMRCSGDMNTGLGTCVIACSLVHDFCTTFDIRYRLINNGDDCVLIIEKADLELVLKHLHEWMKLSGYWFVVEDPVYSMEKISFCQAKPVKTSRGWVMVRDFPLTLAKDSISLLPLKTEVHWKKWANDVGRCGIALTAGVPVLYSWYKALVRSGDGSFGAHPWSSRTGASYLASGLSGEEVAITDEARVSFWEAFGWSPYYQRLVEAELNGLTHDFSLGREGIQQHYNLIIPKENAKHFISNQLYNY
jgi:hypothetical protein